MQLKFYLAELLRELHEERNISWKKLAEQIEKSNDKGITVDRRRLTKLCAEMKNVTLSIDELWALQAYLIENNLVALHENFLFRSPGNLLDALRGERAMTMFYPSRYLESVGTELTSRWDLRACETLLRTPEIARLRVTLEDAFHFGEECTDPARLERKLRSERWYSMLEKEQALISIGSPFVSYATEEILSRMFEVSPYRPHGLNGESRLPFYLYWPEAQHISNSAFSITRKELEARYPDQVANMGPEQRAVLIGDTVHIAESPGESINLVVAQYWKGHLALVLLGIYAPATLAIAECVATRQITVRLPSYGSATAKTAAKRQSSEILITLIRNKTVVTRRTNKGAKVARDRREPVSAELLCSQYWQYVDGQHVHRNTIAYESARTEHARAAA